MNDAAIRQAYQQLQRRRTQTPAPVSLEVVRALAETTTHSDQQLELLDQVLAHPVTRDEYYFLSSLARAETPARRNWIPTGAAAAAIVVVAAGVVFLMRGGNTADPMRGGNDEVVLAAPAADDRFSSGTSFVWRSYPEAARYSVEVLDADGETVWRSTVTDTVAELPSVPLVANAPYTWFVVALRSDGTTTRSTARTIIARP